MSKERIARLQEALPENGAFLVTGAAGRFYLTGLHSSAGSVVITKNTACLFIDFRYVEKAMAVVDSCEVRLSGRKGELGEFLHGARVKELFLEVSGCSVAEKRAYAAALEGIHVSEEDTLEAALTQMRQIKTEKEISMITAAVQLTDETFSYILERIEPGRREIDLMLEMEFFMRKAGSEGVSFDFIVVSGKNSSLPHGVPTQKEIEVGDFVTMDFGAVVGGYRSDMTRTVAVGGISAEQRRVYDTVLAAQQAALDAISPGKKCMEIDKIARDLIDGAGYVGAFGHGLGHSVGLEIHESPAFNTRCQTVLVPGMVMTVEPGIYLEKRFGVRVEDMVVVTEKGCLDLTHSPRELISL